MSYRNSHFNPEGDENADEEELDENNYKTQKDAVLMAINVSSSMLQPPPASDSKKADRDSALAASLKCAYHLMQQRIISNPKDMMGVLLFGTEQSKFQEPDARGGTGGGGGGGGPSYPHCYLFTDLDVPAAEDVRAVKELVEDDEDEEKEVLRPSSERVAMANVLFCANQIFTTRAANFGSRRLFIITDDDDPHQGDKQAKSAAAVRAKDLYDLGVVIELFPVARNDVGFNLAKFYDDIIYRDAAAEANMSEVRTSKSGDGLSLLNSLISNINSKQTAKRALFSNLPFEIAPGLTISVSGYQVLHRQKPERSCYVWLDGDKPQIAVGETSRTTEEGTRSVDKAELKKAYKFGGEYIYFSPEEQKALRHFATPVLRIIGFKPKSSIPMWASVKKSQFIFPSEVDYVGSTRVFSALWQKLLKDDKVGIAWCVTRSNSAPRIVAVVPSRESSDDESGTPYLPAGLWLYPLPFVDDVRQMPERSEGIRPSDNLMTKMRLVVQQLQLPKAMYNPLKYPNPSLQWHYRILQALALEEEVPEKGKDPTEPNYRAISKRAGGYIEDWAAVLQNDLSEAAAELNLKREADDDGVEERPTKKTRVKQEKMDGSSMSDAQVRAAVDSGGAGKMTVAQLKDVLAMRGLSTSGKKGDLVDRLEQWTEDN